MLVLGDDDEQGSGGGGRIGSARRYPCATRCALCASVFAPDCAFAFFPQARRVSTAPVTVWTGLWFRPRAQEKMLNAALRTRAHVDDVRPPLFRLPEDEV